MSKAFRDAIELGKAAAKDKWRDKFAEYDGRQVSHVACRLCGSVIARWMPVGKQEISRVKNQTFIDTKIAFTYLPNYREVLMEMSDGNKHVANMCADCAGKLDEDAMQAAWSMDLSQWASEGATLSDSTCNRYPIRVLKVAAEIKE